MSLTSRRHKDLPHENRYRRCTTIREELSSESLIHLEGKGKMARRWGLHWVCTGLLVGPLLQEYMLVDISITLVIQPVGGAHGFRIICGVPLRRRDKFVTCCRIGIA